MVRQELKPKYDYTCYIVVGTCLLTLVWWLYPNTLVSGGNGLPVYVNGGSWEETRDITFFPEGTKYTVSGRPIFPNGNRDELGELLHLFETARDCLAGIWFTVTICLLMVTTSICYKIITF